MTLGLHIHVLAAELLSDPVTHSAPSCLGIVVILLGTSYFLVSVDLYPHLP